MTDAAAPGNEAPGDRGPKRPPCADRWLARQEELWRVLELGATTIRGVPEPPCLVFDGPLGVRIVREFPADWRELSDDVLLAPACPR